MSACVTKSLSTIILACQLIGFNNTRVFCFFAIIAEGAQVKKSIKIGALIFSRHDSCRLPGKALLKINGQELLGRVIVRSKKLVGVSRVVVATSGRQTDDKIAEFANLYGVAVFRGSVEDVAERAIEACNFYGWDAFVRICGDRPFFDVSIVNDAVANMKDQPCDLLTTSGKFALPPGLTTELVYVPALVRYYDQFKTRHKEHVTSFFYEHKDKFDIRYMNYLSISKGLYPTTLVVDTDVDLQRATWIARELELRGLASEQSAKTLLDLATQWDQHHLINTNYSI